MGFLPMPPACRRAGDKTGGVENVGASDNIGFRQPALPPTAPRMPVFTAPFASSAARGYATTRLCEKSECRDDNQRVDFEILKRH
jgi:hypothetical protein